MKRWMILLSGLMVLLVVLLALFGSPGQTAAAELTPLDRQKEQIATELEDLEQQYRAAINYPGWLHITYKSLVAFGYGGGTLPDGKAIPGESLDETWIFLDGQGVMTQKINLHKTMTGEILQVSIIKDGIGKNLTYPEDVSESVYPKMTIHDMFGRFSENILDTLHDDQMKVEREMLTLDGKETVRVSVFLDLPEPFDNPLVGKITFWKKSAYYDLKTGNLWEVETMVRTEDGRELIASGWTELSFEAVEQLPADIWTLVEAAMGGQDE